MTMASFPVLVEVTLRPGIADPQGATIERALPALGFEGVRNVHIGRLIELDLEDPSKLPEMCERLLSNPLVEDYQIVESADAVESANADSIGSSAGAELPGPGRADG